MKSIKINIITKKVQQLHNKIDEEPDNEYVWFFFIWINKLLAISPIRNIVSSYKIVDNEYSVKLAYYKESYLITEKGIVL